MTTNKTVISGHDQRKDTHVFVCLFVLCFNFAWMTTNKTVISGHDQRKDTHVFVCLFVLCFNFACVGTMLHACHVIA
jgi:hypothetical protein